MKMKTITLSDGWQNPNAVGGQPYRYRVERLGESVEYRLGQMLEKTEVEALCELAEWKVTIVWQS